MKKRIVVTLMGMSLLLAAAPSYGMNVIIDGEKCPLIIKTSLEEDGITLEKEFESFELYGYAQKNLAEIKTEEGTFYVTKNELSSKLPEIPADELPKGWNLNDINAGASGEQVIDLQKELIGLGLLEGEADGSYGQGTAGVIRKFQEEHRLEPTGNADVHTQMLLKIAAAGLDDLLETSYPMYSTAEEKFAKILDQTDADLSPYVDSRWRFKYDPFEYFGTIDPKITLGSFTEEGSDIDKLAMDVSLKVVVSKNAETGRLDVLPCVVTESAGAYRPYIQAVIFSAGGNTVQADGGFSKGELSGASLKESGFVPLTQEALELLAEGNIDAIRIKGKNRNYDIKLDVKKKDISWFGESVKQ